MPASSDTASRKTLKRLQDVSVGVFAEQAQLIANPFPNSVAVIDLAAVVANGGKLPPLPEGSIRWAVRATGTEDDAAYGVLDALRRESDLLTTLLLTVPTAVSRVHASRRVFELLSSGGNDIPVVHCLSFGDKCKDKDELILRAGSEAGALLVDGLGDGVMVSSTGTAEMSGLDLMRTTSFNLLQGCRMRR